MKNCNAVNTSIAVNLKLTREGEGKIINPTHYLQCWSFERINEETKGISLAGRKEDPKIYKRYHGFWSFIFI